MLPGLVIDSVLSGIFGGRRKPGRRALRYLTRGTAGSLWSNPQTVLTAAGLAWGVYETMQAGNGAPTTSSTPMTDTGSFPSPASASSGGAPPPVPPVADADGNTASTTPQADDTMRLVRLAISAAHADGTMGEHERAAVMEQSKRTGVGDLIERELQSPRPLKEIVAGVTDPAAAATLYTLAFSIVRADEQVSGSERIYLAQLAHLLRLDPDGVQALENGAANRIDTVDNDEAAKS
jgi:uncharacterized membrane protein YebE (DUF533 family)